MRLVKTRTLAAAGAAAVAFTGLALASPAAAAAATVHPAVADGSNPESTGCANTAITARSSYGYIGSSAQILVELRYSTACRTTWARITTLNMPACQPGVDNCGDATVHRNSDGREIPCFIGGGSHSCFTAQLNDAGVTSYAYGEADNGALTATASTGSY
jgi:uncharacterized protein DUF2690